MQEKSISNRLQDMKKMSYESQSISDQIGGELNSQGQKLERINDTTKGIERQINKADKTTKIMGSFWYYLKEKIWSTRNIEEIGSTKSEIKDREEIEAVNETRSSEKVVKSELQSENNYEQDLDELCEITKRLKTKGMNINEQLTKQNKMIEEINVQTDKNQEKMGKIQRAINRILGK